MTCAVTWASPTVKATRNGLAQYGAEISTEQRSAIEEALANVEAIVASEDLATQSGDLQKLKATHAALDDSTRPLAELMMDKAMEAMLRKRGLIA